MASSRKTFTSRKMLVWEKFRTRLGMYCESFFLVVLSDLTSTTFLPTFQDSFRFKHSQHHARHCYPFLFCLRVDHRWSCKSFVRFHLPIQSNPHFLHLRIASRRWTRIHMWVERRSTEFCSRWRKLWQERPEKVWRQRRTNYRCHNTCGRVFSVMFACNLSLVMDKFRAVVK